MDFKKLSVQELAQLISPLSGAHVELTNRGVLRTKNVVGELGEYYAINFYNDSKSLPALSPTDVGVKNINALSRDGETYSIKSVSSRNGTTGSFWDPDSIKGNERKFDFLLLVILDNRYRLDMILELTWAEFFQNKKFNKRMNSFNISITKSLINSVKIIFDQTAR